MRGDRLLWCSSWEIERQIQAMCERGEKVRERQSKQKQSSEKCFFFRSGATWQVQRAKLNICMLCFFCCAFVFITVALLPLRSCGSLYAFACLCFWKSKAERNSHLWRLYSLSCNALLAQNSLVSFRLRFYLPKSGCIFGTLFSNLPLFWVDFSSASSVFFFVISGYF